MITIVRVLPLAPPPMHGETIGSYLHRLADANHTTVGILALVIGHGRRYQRTDDTADGWPPDALPKFAALTGRTMPALTHALPALRTARNPDPRIPPTSEPDRPACLACRPCMARRGIHSLVMRRAAHHECVCHRHQRWLHGGQQHDLTPLPEVLRANRHHRHLIRRHDRADTSTNYLQAARLTAEWFRTASQPELHQRWIRRLDALPADPFGDPHHPSDDRITLVTYPESVVLTSLFASPHWRGHNNLPIEAGRRLGIPQDLPTDLTPKNPPSARTGRQVSQ